jgi:uncharacterized iron-regulated membrane protein
MSSQVASPVAGDRPRLSRHAFRRFWDVHAWAGVITSLVVYVMFFLGSLVLFYHPIARWEEPLRQGPPPAMTSLQAPLDVVQRSADPLPEEFYYYLPKEGRGLPHIGYYLPGTTHWREWWLDPHSGRVIPARERAAALLYDLHYLWHGATGYWLQYGAGVLVFGFLLAIVTGVLIHLQNLLRQLNQFRPERAPRVFWSDLHKVAGVFGLPFQLVYALTGTLMALAPLLFSLAIEPVFGGDERLAVDTAGALIDDLPALDYGAPAAPLPLDELVGRAIVAVPGLEPESFVFRGFGRAGATVDVRGPVEGHAFGDGVVQVLAHTGEVRSVETPERETAVGAVARFIHGLHTVEYGGAAARWLMFVLAIAGCATILTGNWVWLERRQTRAPSFGNVLLARLTAGVGAGVIVAVAALLVASRLLPFEWESRGKIEERILALVFFGSITWSACSASTRRTWWSLLAAAGLLLMALPVLELRHSPHGLLGSGPHDASVLAVDAGWWLGSVLLLTAAWLVRKRERRSSQPAAQTVRDAAFDGAGKLATRGGQ